MLLSIYETPNHSSLPFCLGTALVMLLLFRSMSRWKLFPIAFIVAFALVAIVHTSDVQTREEKYKLFGIERHMIPIHDLPITDEGGFTLYISETFILTLFCFSILSLFIKRKKADDASSSKNPIIIEQEKTEPNPKDENLSEVVTPSGNVFKFSSSQDNSQNPNDIEVKKGSIEEIITTQVKNHELDRKMQYRVVIVGLICLVVIIVGISLYKSKISDSPVVESTPAVDTPYSFIVKKIKQDNQSSSDSNMANKDNAAIEKLIAPQGGMAKKLDLEMIKGNTKNFDFKDELNFIGTRFSITYPSSMIFVNGNKRTKIAVIGILDEHNNEFRCVLDFQPLPIKSGTITEKRAALSETSIRKNLMQLAPMVQQFEILSVQDNLIIGTEPASYGETYAKSNKTDAASRPYTVCRSYTFFYNKGVGNVMFYLDSDNPSKETLKQQFEAYKEVINRIVMSFDLYD